MGIGGEKMAVRNFWIDADVDGKKMLLSGGPRAKDGGMRVTIKQRDKGEITTAFTISCREIKGELVTEVFDKNGHIIAAKLTDR